MSIVLTCVEKVVAPHRLRNGTKVNAATVTLTGDSTPDGPIKLLITDEAAHAGIEVHHQLALVTPSVADEAARMPEPDFRERVRIEKSELDEKIVKLETFIGTDTYDGLDTAEQNRLNKQADAMEAYSAVLTERIASFPAEVS